MEESWLSALCPEPDMRAFGSLCPIGSQFFAPASFSSIERVHRNVYCRPAPAAIN
jgi:hypothetical protein